MLTKRRYDEIFELERANEYPIIDAYEKEMGFAISRDLLEHTARTLACPFKANPPNWQHGRVIYATLKRFLVDCRHDVSIHALDIGTAKGFSACIMSHAIAGSQIECDIVSVDIADPHSRIIRNSVAELDGVKSVFEFVKGYVAPSVNVSFMGHGSSRLLANAISQNAHIPFAFVDGKHTYEAVVFEGKSLAVLQRPGDVVIFDDIQIEPVGRAVRDLKCYDIRYVDIGPRIYAIARRT